MPVSMDWGGASSAALKSVLACVPMPRAKRKYPLMSARTVCKVLTPQVSFTETGSEGDLPFSSTICPSTNSGNWVSRPCCCDGSCWPVLPRLPPAPAPGWAGCGAGAGEGDGACAHEELAIHTTKPVRETIRDRDLFMGGLATRGRHLCLSIRQPRPIVTGTFAAVVGQ